MVFPTWVEQSCVPLRGPGAGQGLLLLIWCLSLILLFVLSQMWPRPAEMAGRKAALLLPQPLLQSEGWHAWEGRGKAEESGSGTADTTWFLFPIQSAIPFLIMVAVLDSNLIVTYIVAVAAGISVAAAFLLPW